MRVAVAVVAVSALGACQLGGGPGAADFVDADVAVTPGLASCATAIGRPDLAIDPEGDMSTAEIEALIACTAERAQG